MQIKVIHANGRVIFVTLNKVINNPSNIPLYWRGFKEPRVQGMISSYLMTKESIAIPNPRFIQKFGSI